MNEDLINVSIISLLDYNYFTNRAMRIFLFIPFIFILSSCTTVEVAKELAQATGSIKTSVGNIINTDQKKEKKKDINEIYISIENPIEINKEILKVEKKKEKKLVKEQKKITFNLLGKTLDELKITFGNPQLIRLDGDTQTVRFDTSTCRVFVFFNTNFSISTVEHSEVRNNKGYLINTKEKIHKCFKDFKLT